MTDILRLKNRLIAKLSTRFSFFRDILTSRYEPAESKEIPWTRVRKPLHDSVLAVVTTAGVHHRDQKPFDMKDPNGDPAFRAIDARKPLTDLMITHDYYDHTDPDRDINIVFPIERLREFESAGILGKVADTHYGFMGHILGPHIETLINKTAPEVARLLKKDGVDAVLLTPG
jgi:D-proline reductase (dithiol) PrdB